jgi:large subunit ribosomal protein L30
MAELHIKQVRSMVHSNHKQRDTLRSLKLGRIGRTATVTDNPQTQGMLRAVEHLVEVKDS